MTTNNNPPLSTTIQSIYIPRIHNQCYKADIGGHKFENLEQFIKYTFKHLDIATVNYVDLVPLLTRGGQPTAFSQAFVHLKEWIPGATSEGLLQRMKNFEDNTIENPARLVYDDPHYWILKPNKSIVANINGNNYAAHITLLQQQVTNLTAEIQQYQTNYSETDMNPHSSKRRRKSWPPALTQ